GDPPRLVAVLASDRCDVLLQVGLADDARAAAEGAVAALDGVDAAHLAEARLLLAQACLAAGDLDRAAAEAAAGGGALPPPPPRPRGAPAGRPRGPAAPHRRPRGRRRPSARAPAPGPARAPAPRPARLAGRGAA